MIHLVFLEVLTYTHTTGLLDVRDGGNHASAVVRQLFNDTWKKV